jgi:hypothetical protein
MSFSIWRQLAIVVKRPPGPTSPSVAHQSSTTGCRVCWNLTGSTGSAHSAVPMFSPNVKWCVCAASIATIDSCPWAAAIWLRTGSVSR